MAIWSLEIDSDRVTLKAVESESATNRKKPAEKIRFEIELSRIIEELLTLSVDWVSSRCDQHIKCLKDNLFSVFFEFTLAKNDS